jgi:hypothetical protein
VIVITHHQAKFSLLYVQFEEDFVRRAAKYKGRGGGYSLQAMLQAALKIEGRSTSQT